MRGSVGLHNQRRTDMRARNYDMEEILLVGELLREGDCSFMSSENSQD